MEQHDLERIFEEQFNSGMKNKDFEEFKKSRPTLLKVVLNSLNEVRKQADKSSKILHPSKAFKLLAVAINWFNEKNYRADQLSIYCPNWYMRLLVEEASKEVFVAKIEPFKFMGIEFVAGYENAIIVTNSRTRDVSFQHQITQQRIELN